MTAKKYLLQIYNLDKEIDSKQSERDEIMSTLLKAVDTTNEPIGSTGTVSDTTGNTVMKLMEYNNRTNREIDKLVDLKVKISGEIAELEERTHRMILRERYIHCKKWEKIAVEQHIDLRWLYRLHGKALKEFEETHLTIQSH